MSAAAPRAVSTKNGSSPANGPGKRQPRFVAQSAVAFDQRLEPGAVRLYFALDDYAGYSGKCHPHQATLAKRLGVSERTIRRWLTQLIDLGYISVRRTGRGSWCTLAWVGVESDRTGTSDQGPEKDVRSDRTSVSGAYKEEPRSWTGSPSSSSTAGEGRGPRPHDDDDDQEPPQERKTQNPSPGDPLVREVRGTLEAWFERRGSPKPLNRPSDPIPDEVIADELGKRHASILELKDFLDGDYTSRLIQKGEPPRTWKHVCTSVLNWLDTYGLARPPSNSDNDYDRAREAWKAKRARAAERDQRRDDAQ